MNWAVQDELGGMEAPVSVNKVVPGFPARAAPVHVEDSPVGLAMVRFAGKVSLTLTVVRVVPAFGLVKVKVTVEKPPELMDVGLKDLVTVGGELTVKLAVAVRPVPPFVEVTALVVLVAVPPVVSVTVAVTVQLAAPAIEPPVNFIDVVVEVVTEPLVHVVAAPVCVMPDGRLSVTATPVSVVDALGFVIVRVRVDVPPEPMPVGLNDLVIVGAATTVKVALAVRPLPPFVELTAPVVLTDAPGVLVVAVAVTVQLPLAAMDAPLMTIEVDVEEAVLPPVQVVAKPEAVMPAGRVSVMPTPVRVKVFAAGLVIVIVNVEFAPAAIGVGEKALATVGGAMEVRVAFAVRPVPSFVELTVPVVLTLFPPVVVVTFTEIVQLLPGVAIEPPVKLIGEALEVNVPPQLFVGLGVPATAMPAGKVSLTAIPFIVPEVVAGFVIVMVNVEVPPTAMLVGAKDFVIVGGAVTVKVADAVEPVPAFVALTVPVVLA